MSSPPESKKAKSLNSELDELDQVGKQRTLNDTLLQLLQDESKEQGFDISELIKVDRDGKLLSEIMSNMDSDTMRNAMEACAGVVKTGKELLKRGKVELHVPYAKLIIRKSKITHFMVPPSYKRAVTAAKKIEFNWLLLETIETPLNGIQKLKNSYPGWNIHNLMVSANDDDSHWFISDVISVFKPKKICGTAIGPLLKNSLRYDIDSVEAIFDSVSQILELRCKTVFAKHCKASIFSAEKINELLLSWKKGSFQVNEIRFLFDDGNMEEKVEEILFGIEKISNEKGGFLISRNDTHQSPNEMVLYINPKNILFHHPL